MLDLAIVGGGPGGLMSAWYLKKKLGDLCRVTIYEASDRVGGKIVTRKFDSAPAMYEAGVAEIYDYSMTGPDPLRELIQHFGLQTIPMDAEQVQLDGELLNDVPGMRRKYGAKTAAAIEAFRKRCSDMVSPIEYYEGVGAHDNEHPWAYMTSEELLDKDVDDATAKRFFKVMARSDLATEQPQHQRAQRAEELRDGCRRLYRPVFDPERQRATDRVPALGGRRPTSSSITGCSRSARPRAAATSST